MFEKMKQKAGLAGLALKRHSPEIYLGAGIAAGVVSVVLIAKAHKKSDEVFDDIFRRIDDMDEYIIGNNDVGREIEEDGGTPHYITSTERKRLMAPIYVDFAKRAAILYGPGILAGVASITLILTSHGILRGRNRSLVATVGILQQGFTAYRKRVVDELGKEADERFFFGAESRALTTVTVDADGKKVKTKNNVNHIPEVYTPKMYERIFDDTCSEWRIDPDMTELFLRSNERYANDILQLRGYILLNEVYKALGYEETPYGAVVGWALNVPGDDYVSFGLDNDINQRESDIRWILDFNVNGVVYEVIGE